MKRKSFSSDSWKEVRFYLFKKYIRSLKIYPLVKRVMLALLEESGLEKEVRIDLFLPEKKNKIIWGVFHDLNSSGNENKLLKVEKILKIDFCFRTAVDRFGSKNEKNQHLFVYFFRKKTFVKSNKSVWDQAKKIKFDI